jgi:hypothetical protein
MFSLLNYSVRRTPLTLRSLPTLLLQLTLQADRTIAESPCALAENSKSEGQNSIQVWRVRDPGGRHHGAAGLPSAGWPG